MSIANPTTDIAIHNTISDPFDAVSNSPHDQPKKKKKKRYRENDQEADEALRGKKKQRKKRSIEPDGVQEPAGDAISLDVPTGDVPPRKKKSKKKDKEKHQVEIQSPGAQVANLIASDDANSQASTAAFLSAIVAAAAGTPDISPSHMQLPPQFHSDIVPHPEHPYDYPPVQYGYDAPHFALNPMQPSSLFPTPMGLPFSELAFGSNEDVLRALQDLDISKIANVLKTLGEAAAAVNVSSYDGAAFMAPHSTDQTTPLGQVPAASGAILSLPAKETGSRHRRTIDMSLPGTEHHTSADHAHLLANKWLNANKLAELVKTQGLVYKKGKFSAIEEQQLKTAIETYRMQKQLREDQMQDIIFPKSEKNKDNAFWSEITAAVPQRPIIAVYHHVRRSHHPMKQQGKWMPEEDAMLKQAVADLGQQWEKVSERVLRMSSDCRDRYRNHIINRDIRVTGHWTKEEEDELTRIVTSMTVQQGKDIDNDVFWGRVSELMGGKRGRQQCRIKWTDALSKTVKNEGLKPRWSQQDAFILVHKVDSLNVRDDTEIDWKTISDPQWNLWSAHTLQRRWLTMKKGIKGHEDMTHQEIMDILRVKKAHLPTTPAVSARKRKERKVTSAAAIADSDLQRDTVVNLEAGSSTSPGTLAGAGSRYGAYGNMGAGGESGHDHDADGSTDADG